MTATTVSETTHTYHEASLLQELAAGSDVAFARIYQHYWERVYDVALMMLKDTGLAEDIVQETFLRLWQKRHAVGAINNFPAYLHVMARNLILSGFRKKSPSYTLDQLPEHHATLQETTLLPLRELERRETTRLLGRAVGRLSSRQREIYVLSSEEDISLKEVAQKMNISYDSARQYKSQALQIIRLFLEHNSALVLFTMTLPDSINFILSSQSLVPGVI